MSGEKLYTFNDGVLTFSSNIKTIDRSIVNSNVFNHVQKIIIPPNISVIEEKAFCSCPKLTSVIFSEGVEVINERAFANCKNLKELRFPDSLKTIANYAFQGCYSVKDITFGNGLVFIGEGAFDNCNDIKNVYIESIADWCKIDFKNLYSNPLHFTEFFHVKELKNGNLTIPDGVTRIGSYAFADFHCFNSIRIPPSVKSIGSFAFYLCEDINEVHISDLSAWCKIDFTTNDSNPTFHAETLFLNDKEIINLVIPDDIDAIQKYAFIYLSHLKSITIPGNVKVIDRDAFFQCRSVETIKILDGVEIIKNAFAYIEDLKLVYLPQTITNIDDNAFEFYLETNTIFKSKNNNIIKTWANKNNYNLQILELSDFLNSITNDYIDKTL